MSLSIAARLHRRRPTTAPCLVNYLIGRPLSCSAPQRDIPTQEEIDLLRERRKKDLKRRQQKGTGGFIDWLVVDVKAGNGGNGAVAFAKTATGLGPPSGGSGGQGGSIYFQPTSSLSSLATVPKRIRALHGGHGLGDYRIGRRGADMIIPVPVGTVVKEVYREADEAPDEDEDARRARLWVHYPGAEEGNMENPAFLAAEKAVLREERIKARGAPPEEVDLDFDKPSDAPVLVAQGGSGGSGNPAFTTTTVRFPRFARRGQRGAHLTLNLELKLLADAGLVGFPNAGKSTLLRALTGRRSEIAGYAFTTLNPQIGVVRARVGGGFIGAEEGREVLDTRDEVLLEDERRAAGAEWVPGPGKNDVVPERLRYTLLDNPGLLPDASLNKGLGHSFLRSIERSPVLIYVLDLASASPVHELDTLVAELEAYLPGLSARGRVVVANKADLLGGDGADEVEVRTAHEKLRELEEHAQKVLGDDVDVVPVSARWRLGLDRVVDAISDRVEKAREKQRKEQEALGELDI